MNQADKTYESIMGWPSGRLAAERTPEERHASLEKLFAIVDSLTDEELTNNPLAGRPLNTSILEENHPADVSAA